MAKYKYRAVDGSGKAVKGVMEAADEAELYTRLRSGGLYLKTASPAEKEGSSRKIKAKVLAEFCRSLGTLLGAGVSLVRALAMVSQEETTKPVYRKIYEDVLRRVRQGTPLSEAMEEQGKAFPPLLIHMFRSAEASGSLDKASIRMASHYDKEYRMHSKLVSAMTYPCILLGLIVVVVLIIFTFVIPQFEDLFSQMEELPALTKGVMAFKDLLVNHWLLILVVLAAAVVLFRALLRIPAVCQKKDKIKVHLPLVGKLLKVVYTARFARTLSSLYSAGLPIVQALQVGCRTVGNSYIESQFDEAVAKVRGGATLSEALRGIDGFITKLSSSILVGEETGSLDSMLDSTADTLDYESEMAINRMVTFLEPAMIVVMAILVGIVVIAVIMPIYGSYDAIESSALN